MFEYTIAEDEQFSNYEIGMLNKVAYSSAMDGLKDFRHNKFQNVIKEVGFKNVRVDNISENTGPSLNRLRKFMIVPYYIFIKPSGLQEKFPNATVAVEFYKMAKKGLIRYNIFTAEK